MVLDFGFLKHVMMEYCDDLCDHGTVVWVDDPLLHVMIPAKQYRDMVIHTVKREPMIYCLVNENRDRNQTKVLVVPFIPTAERLAEFWFKLMVDRVHELSQGLAELSEVEVFETPNCSARYPQ
jgi:6-pyruvoyl-tetrahydropterin synthase